MLMAFIQKTPKKTLPLKGSRSSMISRILTK